MAAVLTGVHTAINWGDPLAKGLFCYVVHPSGGRPVDLAKRYTLSYTGTAAWGGGAGAYGPASVHTNSGSSGYYLASGALSGSTAGSILIIRRKTDTTNRATGFGSTAFNVNAFGVLLPFSDGTVYWDFGGNAGTNRISKSGLTFNARDSVYIFTAGPTGMYMYQDGLLVASSSTAPSARTPTNQPFGLTYGNSQSSSDNRVDTLYVAADRQWSPAEVAQWTANPFRVAETRPSLAIYTPFTTTHTGSSAVTLGQLSMAGAGTVLSNDRAGSGSPVLGALVMAGAGVGPPRPSEDVSHDVRTGQPDPQWRNRGRATWPPPLKTRGSNYGRY